MQKLLGMIILPNCKLIEINFSKDGKILNAKIQSYLLEKSRVVHFQEGEENFKIFYQFVLGKNEEDKKKYMKNISTIFQKK